MLARSISFKSRILLILTVDEYDRMHSIIAEQVLERQDADGKAMLVAESRSVMNQNMAGMKDCRQNHIHLILQQSVQPARYNLV